MDHDRLFKLLLTTFFLDFLKLFYPELHQHVDPNSIEFLEKEIFTDLTSGRRHEVDLIVKVRIQGQAAFFLIHIEMQSKAEPGFARRMFCYFSGLLQKFDLPVYPIAMLSYDLPRRPEPDRYEVEFPDLKVLDFHFRTIQLNRLNWRDFMRTPNPVAVALMAKMNVAPEDRPKVKLQCLRLLATLKLDRARMHLISGFVDSYLKLNAREQRVFEKELKTLPREEKEKAMEIVTSWMKEGIKQGRKEGRQEGRQEGDAQIVLRILRRRFGPISPALEQRIRGLPAAQLEDLAEAQVDFASLAQARAWLSARR